MKEVVIAGWYGNKNTGDEAILSATIADLRIEIPNLHITVVSDDPEYTRKLHKVDAISPPKCTNNIRKMDLKKDLQFTRLVHNADLFILGGGGLIQPGSVGHLLKILHAKMVGVKTMLYAVGVQSPLLSYREKLLTRFVLNYCTDVITVRNEMSKSILIELGVKRSIYVTADPAINLPTADHQRINEIFQQENIPQAKPLVALCLRNWNSPGLKKRFLNRSAFDETKSEFGKVLSDEINYLTNELDRNVLIAPLLVSENGNDRRDMENLVNNPNLNKDSIYIIRGEYTPQEIKGILSKTEFIVGMRLHSLIFGATHYIPLIGLSYLPKVSEFMKQIDLSSYCVDISEEVDWKTLKSMIDNLIMNKESISNRIKNKIINLQEKAHVNAKIAAKLITE